MLQVWAASKLCAHFDVSLRCVWSKGALMNPLATTAVCHSTVPASLHQHSSSTCGTHHLQQQLSCGTECQTPSWGGRCTCAVGTAPHSYLLQRLSYATGRNFTPSSRHAAADGHVVPWLLAAPCTSASPRLGPPAPHHSCNTSHSTDCCGAQSNGMCDNSALQKAKATHP